MPLDVRHLPERHPALRLDEDVEVRQCAVPAPCGSSPSASGPLSLSVSTVSQPSVVVPPLTIAGKAALKEAHDPSRAWSRIAIPRLQLPIEICTGAVRATSVAFRKHYRTELIACGYRNPLLDTRTTKHLDELGQLVRRSTVFVESRAPECLAQKTFRHLTTVVLLRERQNRRGPGKALFHIVAVRRRTREPWQPLEESIGTAPYPVMCALPSLRPFGWILGMVLPAHAQH